MPATGGRVVELYRRSRNFVSRAHSIAVSASVSLASIIRRMNSAKHFCWLSFFLRQFLRISFFASGLFRRASHCRAFTRSFDAAITISWLLRASRTLNTTATIRPALYSGSIFQLAFREKLSCIYPYSEQHPALMMMIADATPPSAFFVSSRTGFAASLGDGRMKRAAGYMMRRQQRASNSDYLIPPRIKAFSPLPYGHHIAPPKCLKRHTPIITTRISC